MGPDRFRCGTGPISSRNRTDFGAEPDRSRAGTGPISSRNRTDLGEAGGARAVHRRVTIRVGATTGGRAANLGT